MRSVVNTSHVTKSPRSTQPCILSRSLNRVPTSICWGKGGNVTSVGWQVGYVIPYGEQVPVAARLVAHCFTLLILLCSILLGSSHTKCKSLMQQSSRLSSVCLSRVRSRKVSAKFRHLYRKSGLPSKKNTTSDFAPEVAMNTP